MLDFLGLEMGMAGMGWTATRGIGLAAALAAALMLSGCKRQTAGLDADKIETASTSSGPSFKKTEALSNQWKNDQGNVGVALAYAASLEQLGQKPAQIEVLKTTAGQTRGNADAQAELGRALFAAGDMGGATETLARANELNPQNPQVLSVLGATLDQQSRHGEAREKYEAALAIAPNDVGTMNNLAMSYALQGKLPEAEKILRKALGMPGGKNMPRIRQNLALVVGLQGRFDEAKQIASEDLPPDQVQANMAYLQQMLGKQNTWSQLKDGG
jgi:Flp pilus assembly protein TadD